MATSTTNIIKVKEPLQQGDTFTLRFQYKENDTAADLPEGIDLIAALYDRKWNVLQSAKLSDGTIQSLNNHVYAMDVTHESSMNMTSVVYLEVSLANSSLTSVDHAKQIIQYEFETRKNNNLL